MEVFNADTNFFFTALLFALGHMAERNLGSAVSFYFHFTKNAFISAASVFSLLSLLFSYGTKA